MSWLRSTPSYRKITRYSPKLEALEDRCTPTVTFTFDNDTLFITGDNGNNFILITDSGSLWLIEAKRQGKSRLVGRYMCLAFNGDSTPWVGEIVNEERIDGEWTNGRWDLRRKIADN